MTIESLLVCVVLVALVAAFFILLATKLGIVEWMQVHGDKFISGMANCTFCLSFWTCTVLFVGVACWYDEVMLIFGGMLSSPITRYLV